MYHATIDQEIHERLRSEVRDMLEKSGGKITYDSVMNDMPYLHQVLMETLRMYPILSMLDRTCISSEGYSLQPFNDFVIPEGMPSEILSNLLIFWTDSFFTVYIPIYGIHLDEKHFPNPHKFDPDRFAQENLPNITPYTHFPFGSGPRNCVGERFGLLQVKTAIAKILRDFRLEPTARTPKTIVLQKASIVVQSLDGLFVNLVKDPIIV